MAREFSGFLKSHGVEAYSKPYDLVLKDYLVESRTALFAAIPCLAQHIGRVSTGLGTFHHALHFQEKL